jgi:hypothetical protein
MLKENLFLEMLWCQVYFKHNFLITDSTVKISIKATVYMCQICIVSPRYAN